MFKTVLTAMILCMLSFAVKAGDYRITLKEAEDNIARALMDKGLGQSIEAHVVGRTGEDLVRGVEPVVMEITDLEVQEDQQRFKASLLFSTEAQINKPARTLGSLLLNGRYEEMVSVPVMKYRISEGDVIREEDITWQKLPGSRTRRDTITDAKVLVGSTPVRGLSPLRPVRESEVKTPPVVMRNSLVQMVYQKASITIQAVGTAMQDGAMGDRIRVRNDDSGVMVDAVVTDKGKVQVVAR